MGNEQSKKTNNIEIELNHSRINFIRVVNDPKYKHMQVVFAAEKNQYNKWKGELEKAKLDSTHLLLPFDHHFESRQLCGTTGSVQVKYENYPYLMLEQVENRRAKKKRFDETELWLLLYCLLDAQKEMKSGNSSRIGDVRPQNIFFNEDGLMKVANLLSWPKQTTNYQKFLENEPTYLAPEDMPLIQSSQVDNSENSQSQIFSIGLTILSAANLTDYKFLYNTTSRKFNIELFNNILNQWRLNDFYSDIFKATLCSLLEVDKSNRITEETIFPWIQKYRQNILVRKDFVISDPPQLIINQVQITRRLYQNTGQQSFIHAPLGIFGSDFKKVGAPLEGSRRFVQQKRYAPVSILPSSQLSDSMYNSAERPTYMQNFLLQGTPIGTSNPVFINRTSIPSIVQNQTSGESVYTKTWTVQGGSNIPKMNFDYSPSAERKVEPAQKSNEKVNQQEQNQPQISEDKPQQKSQKKE